MDSKYKIIKYRFFDEYFYDTTENNDNVVSLTKNPDIVISSTNNYNFISPTSTDNASNHVYNDYEGVCKLFNNINSAAYSNYSAISNKLNAFNFPYRLEMRVKFFNTKNIRQILGFMHTPNPSKDIYIKDSIDYKEGDFFKIQDKKVIYVNNNKEYDTQVDLQENAYYIFGIERNEDEIYSYIELNGENIFNFKTENTLKIQKNVCVGLIQQHTKSIPGGVYQLGACVDYTEFETQVRK